MNVMVKGRNRPERVHPSEFQVDVDLCEDGSLIFRTMTGNAELQVGILLGRDGAALRIVGLNDLMKIDVNEGQPFKNGDKTEVMTEVIIQLNDFMHENSIEGFQDTGEVLLGILRSMVLTAERALSNRVDFVAERAAAQPSRTK